MSLNKVKDILKKNKNFLITSHINLEGDSIGSQLALYRLLKILGKNVSILDQDEPAPQYNFLPYIKKINTDLKADLDYDVAIVLDCPVLERMGDVAKILDRRKILVNIDHHISNTYFGDINWVESRSSSCGEMVYRLYCAFNKPVKKDVALLLYVAILTDTGSFGYENTTAKTHLIAKELIENKLCPVDIHNKIYETRSLAEIRLLRKVLSTLRVTHDGKIAYLYVSRKMLSKAGCEPSVTEGFVNYARSLDGIKVALLFLENPYEPDNVQVSFRSKGEINVNKVASHFNGGGHHNAAGCVVKGSLKKVVGEVLRVVKSLV